MARAVYIHIPFCKSICSYCSFCKFYYQEEKARVYLDALEREIKDTYNGERIETLYIGGGTPSDLSLSNLKKLLQIIRLFKINENYEFSFECNLDITEDKLILLKEYGVNRLSFGIETTHLPYLELIHRSLNKTFVKKKIAFCRSLGFSNINGDLMYAFFDEGDEILKEDLSFLLSLDLEHISTYSLMIEKHTELYLRKYQNCSEEKDSRMYQIIHEVLTKSKYEHYEVSNFSKKGYESKHNLVYWHNEEYYGFGVGASGYLDDVRYSNTKSFSHYIEGKKRRVYLEKLSLYDRMSYEMILGLRLREGISFQVFYSKYQKSLEEEFYYKDLIENGLLKIKGERVFIPYENWYVMNSILERFVK